MLHSKEATESSKRFMEKLLNGELEIDREPYIDDGVDITEEYIEKRLESYNAFLQSDLGKMIMEMETPEYMGDN